jgi:hypothetical protein
VKHLGWRHSLECVRNFLLPSEPGLAVDLSRGREFCTDFPVLVQQNGTQHDLVVTEDLLRVVDVACAVLAEVLEKENISTRLDAVLKSEGSRTSGGDGNRICSWIDLRSECSCQSRPCRCTFQDPCPW